MFWRRDLMATELQAFEREALDALDSVYRFAWQLTHDPVDTEDLVQDTFLRAFQHRHQYQLGTNCTAWLFTICRNLWIQQRQREERITSYDDTDLEDIATSKWALDSGAPLSPAIFDLPEFDDVLRRALASIPETYRTPVVLIDIEDYTYATAAGVLDVPIGTVRSRLFRGRRLLQRRLVAYAQDAGLIPESPAPPGS